MSTSLIIVIVVVVLIVVVGLVLRFRTKKNRNLSETSTPGDENNQQVYVGNLSYQVTEQNLKDFFGQYGTITQVRIVRNYSSGRSKGFGFVTYSSPKEANKSLVAHGQKYQDRTIVVRIAKPR